MPLGPMLRAAHILPYLNFCYDKGLSVEQLLRQFRLPASLDAQPDARLPVLPALKLLAHIERSACVQDIGILANRYVSLKLFSQANRQAISTATTLRAALIKYIAGTQIEASSLSCWIVEREQGVRICTTHDVAATDEEARPLQIHFALLMLSIVKAFAGQNWKPVEIGFKSCIPLSPLVGHVFPRTQFLFRQDHSWIIIPKGMLELPGNSSRLTAVPEAGDAGVPAALLVDDYIEALKAMLKIYLPDGYPNIELVAEIMGTSVRSLQRTLAQLKTTYSKVVEQARVEAAMELLENSKDKIIDVAYAVGYEDPSHFSRAFRRLKGTSPREFRLSGTA
jgi:AraC-like DNA-binding protein